MQPTFKVVPKRFCAGQLPLLFYFVVNVVSIHFLRKGFPLFSFRSVGDYKQHTDQGFLSYFISFFVPQSAVFSDVVR
jgi:hypothetical protein